MAHGAFVFGLKTGTPSMFKLQIIIKDKYNETNSSRPHSKT
jgi:hypothetical protein